VFDVRSRKILFTALKQNLSLPLLSDRYMKRGWTKIPGSLLNSDAKA